MSIIDILKMPFSQQSWRDLQSRNIPIAKLAWLLVVPMSFLPPVMLFYAGTHFGDDYLPSFAERNWHFITTVLFLAELLTFFVMGWLIFSVLNNQGINIDYQRSYLLAAFAPLPMWLSSLSLFVPFVLFNAVVVIFGLWLSCMLIYTGINALCERKDNDLVSMTATYAVIAASLVAWMVLMLIVWLY